MSSKSFSKSRKDKPKRVLVRWSDDHDKTLLLAMQYACTESGMKIPWEKVAEVMGPNFSEGAIVQHLAKLRGKMVEADIPVPPPIKRGMVTKAPSKIYGATPKKRNITEASQAASASPSATTTHRNLKTPKGGRKRGKNHSCDGNDEEEELGVIFKEESQDDDTDYGSPKKKKPRKSSTVKRESLEEDDDDTPRPASENIRNDSVIAECKGPATRTRAITLCYAKPASTPASTAESNKSNTQEDNDYEEEEEDDDDEADNDLEDQPKSSKPSSSSSSPQSNSSGSRHSTTPLKQQPEDSSADKQVIVGNEDQSEGMSLLNTPFQPTSTGTAIDYISHPTSSTHPHDFRVPPMPTHAHPDLRISTTGHLYSDHGMYRSPSFLDGFSTPASMNSSFSHNHNPFMLNPSPITPTAMTGMGALNLNMSQSHLHGYGHGLAHSQSQDEIPSSAMTNQEDAIHLFGAVDALEWEDLVDSKVLNSEDNEFINHATNEFSSFDSSSSWHQI